MREPDRGELEDLALAWLFVERGVANRPQVDALLGRRAGRRLVEAVPPRSAGAAAVAELLPVARARVRACLVCGRGLTLEAGPWSRPCATCSDGKAQEIAAAKIEDQIDTTSAAPGLEDASTARKLPHPGEIFAGWTIEREIGRGAMGSVYRARRGREAPVALKVMTRVGPDELRLRFLREGKALSRMQHPNVVAVREVGDEQGVLWIAMEYVEGRPLSEVAEEKYLPVERSLAICETIARALEHAHSQGLVHRDLKPQNVLVTATGDVKVVDFGLAKDLNTVSPLTREGQVLGTPHYLAPESVVGNPDLVTTAADVYSLGVILYELVTGTLPFAKYIASGLRSMLRAIAEAEVEPPSARVDGLPPGLDAVVMRALDRRLEHRYPNAAAFAADLALLRRGEQPVPLTAPVAAPAAAKTASTSRVASAQAARVGEFEVLEIVGRGGSGVVHRGRAPDGRDVAIKFLLEADESHVARFERERRILGLLGESDGFVPLLAHGTCERGPYVVMPFVGGGNLRDRIKRALPHDQALSILRSVVAAMAQAHARGIIHRDLKPDNVLFTSEGKPLVADLGLAKHFAMGSPGASRSIALTKTGEFRGTVGYMPAEQMFDSRASTPASDVFALGAIAYECLAGDPPFRGASLMEIATKVDVGRFEPLDRVKPGTPTWLAHAIHRALAPEPLARFRDAAAFAEALAGPGTASSSPRRALAGTVVAGVAVLGLLAAAFALGRRSSGSAVVEPATAPVASGLSPAPQVSTPAPVVVSPGSASPGPVELLADVPLAYERVLETKKTRLAAIWGRPDGKHSTDVYGVAVGRDGSHVLSGSAEGALRLWELRPVAGTDTLAFRERLNMPGHLGSVISVALSGESPPRRAASASSDGTLRIWDLAHGGAPLATLVDGKGPVKAVALSPNGRRALAGGDDGVLRLWDLESRKVVRRLDARCGGIEAVALSADLAWALSGHADGTARVWDLGSDLTQEAALVFRGHKAGKKVVGVAFSPDGKRAASSGEDGSVRVWEPATGTELGVIAAPASNLEIQALDFAPDGRVVFGVIDGLIHVLNVDAARNDLTISGHAGDAIWSVAVRPDGRSVVSGSADGTVRLWDLETGREISSLAGQEGHIAAIAVSPDGTRVATGGGDKRVRVWDPARGTELLSLDAQSHVNAVAFSPDGGTLACATANGFLRVWDAATGEEQVRAAAPAFPDEKSKAPGDDEPDVQPLELRSLAYESSGRVLVGNGAGSVGLWNLKTPSLAWTSREHDASVEGIVVAPDGRTAISGARDKKFVVWDLATGHPTSTFQGHDAMILALALTRDGRFLVSGDASGRLFAFDLASRAAAAPLARRELVGHEGAILFAAVSADGRLAATSGRDKTVRIWNLSTGSELDRITLAPDDAPGALAFLPRSRSLLVGTARGVVLRFELLGD